jgi:hypothetical protein
MKRFVLLFLFLPALCLAQTETAGDAPAEGTPTSVPNQLPLWRCKLPGGAYQVALRSIVAISSHEYVVDGAARVTEVNIDTQGTLVCRFYYLEPNLPNSPVGGGEDLKAKGRELLNEAGARTGQDAWKKVVKSYPVTTHARTVEYRLQSKEQLQALFGSIETAWRTGKGADFAAQ